MRAIPRSIFLKTEAAQDRLARATFNEKAAMLNARKAVALAKTFIVIR